MGKKRTTTLTSSKNTMTVSTTWVRCDHLEGWFKTLRFWFWHRQYFFCKDCGAVIIKSTYDMLHPPKPKPNKENH